MIQFNGRRVLVGVLIIANLGWYLSWFGDHRRGGPRHLNCIKSGNILVNPNFNQQSQFGWEIMEPSSIFLENNNETQEQQTQQTQSRQQLMDEITLDDHTAICQTFHPEQCSVGEFSVLLVSRSKEFEKLKVSLSWRWRERHTNQHQSKESQFSMGKDTIDIGNGLQMATRVIYANNSETRLEHLNKIRICFSAEPGNSFTLQSAALGLDSSAKELMYFSSIFDSESTNSTTVTPSVGQQSKKKESGKFVTVIAASSGFVKDLPDFFCYNLAQFLERRIGNDSFEIMIMNKSNDGFPLNRGLLFNAGAYVSNPQSDYFVLNSIDMLPYPDSDYFAPEEGTIVSMASTVCHYILRYVCSLLEPNMIGEVVKISKTDFVEKINGLSNKFYLGMPNSTFITSPLWAQDEGEELRQRISKKELTIVKQMETNKMFHIEGIPWVETTTSPTTNQVQEDLNSYNKQLIQDMISGKTKIEEDGFNEIDKFVKSGKVSIQLEKQSGQCKYYSVSQTTKNLN